MHRHANGVTRRLRLLNVSLRSTAGGREYFACGKGLNDDGESRRPDIFEQYTGSGMNGRE